MTKKLQHIFALSEKGAKDLVKAVLWCFVCNVALMLPVGAVLFTAQHLLGCLENGGSPMEGFWIYAGFALAVLVLLFILHWFQYASLYLATYKESANRRVSLAETLRRLPLSFFGNRDLSDLTSTMIADCSSLDQMFSHYVPQLFASIGFHAGNRRRHVPVRLAHGAGHLVGGAGGDTAHGRKQENPGFLSGQKTF